MEILAEQSPLLKVTEEEVLAIRKSINLGDESSIARDVDMVLEWYDKQQHLPRIQLDRKFVERVLVSRKGSVEQTKQKIDMFFTLRSLIPDLATPRDILHPEIQQQFKSVRFGIMPKLNTDLTRVHVFQLTPDVDNFDLASAMKYIFMTVEYRLKYDYCAGDRYVCDLRHVSLGHLTKLHPVTLKNTELYLQKGNGTRLRGMHYINCPSYMNKILAILKSGFSEKLANRLMVHTDLEDLHKYVSKDALPKDFGGTGPSVDELCENLHKELRKDEHRQYLISQEKLKSDERLRIGGQIDDVALGIPGSFKKLSVD